MTMHHEPNLRVLVLTDSELILDLISWRSVKTRTRRMGSWCIVIRQRFLQYCCLPMQYILYYIKHLPSSEELGHPELSLAISSANWSKRITSLSSLVRTIASRVLRKFETGSVIGSHACWLCFCILHSLRTNNPGPARLKVDKINFRLTFSIFEYSK